MSVVESAADLRLDCPHPEHVKERERPFDHLPAQQRWIIWIARVIVGETVVIIVGNLRVEWLQPPSRQTFTLCRWAKRTSDAETRPRDAARPMIDDQGFCGQRQAP